MQENQLTLSVDATNVGTPADEIYSRFDEDKNRSSYIGATHAPDDRDLLGLYRTFPTRSGNFKGVGKSAFKFTRDCTVAGVDSSTTLTSPLIIEVSFSVPVGTPAAELVHARQRVLALLDDDTFMDSLNVQQMV